MKSSKLLQTTLGKNPRMKGGRKETHTFTHKHTQQQLHQNREAAADLVQHIRREKLELQTGAVSWRQWPF